MTNDQMRAAIRAAYPGEKWYRRVDNMSESQVVAIYIKMKKEGKV